MHTTLMTKTQEGRWSWALAQGQATRVPAATLPRYLSVTEGRVWLTHVGSADAFAPDLWLERGERVELPAGVEVVVEGWPAARFELLEAAPAARVSPLHALVAWLRNERQRLQLGPVSCV